MAILEGVEARTKAKEIKMTYLTTIRAAVSRRAAYNRTRRELRAMPRQTAWDLGLMPEDANRIARSAVYG
ncbi:hypothetical protein DFP88_10727 [Pseudoroseicyclus aestuarii]|uniref:DUF1127 domain-containing protein n=2 Tax=Pseudoroseicyclus aestuarii TaxID=1795041 RepID=A0A318SSY6_9RHOB|nr:hypothetical protein DFP88_10727 [Pseudoroseicyclus aestuarii]